MILSNKKNNKENKPGIVRILQIVSSLNVGSGVLAVVLNWHRNIDKSKIQFDYLYVLDSPAENREEIEKLGGQYYKLPNPCKTPFKFLIESYRFFKKHHYHTIHSHITHLNFFFYPLAKMFGTKNIIQHAHGTKWSDKKLNGWRNYLMLHTVWPLITHKLACSEFAGKFWYGKNYTVINNGIDLEKFKYNPNVRTLKRKELGLEDNFVIGHVGRFSSEKNHRFLIEIFEQVYKKDNAARLILVGSGPLEQEIKNLVNTKNLQEKVLFLGVRKDVAALYQVFDIFCLPSLHEGMPVVAIEAQASDLPCVFADTITKEVLILPDSKMFSLKDLPEVWTEEILKFKGYKRHCDVYYSKIKGFDIKDIAKQMEKFYEGLN